MEVTTPGPGSGETGQPPPEPTPEEPTAPEENGDEEGDDAGASTPPEA